MCGADVKELVLFKVRCFQDAIVVCVLYKFNGSCYGVGILEGERQDSAA